MFVVIFTNAQSFANPAEAIVGPFKTEYGARHWAGRNCDEGATYRIVEMVDIAEATVA